MVSKKKIITYLLALYCCLMPFEEALASSFGSILKIIGMVLISIIIISYKNNWRLSRYQIPLILWTVYMFTSVIWSDSIQWWSYFFKIYVVQIILLCLVDMVSIKYIDVNVIKKALILGGCLASIIMIFFPSNSGYTDEGRRTIMLLGTTLDPNIVASIILLGTQVSIGEFYSAKKRSFKYVFMATLQLFGIFLTGSRGALLAFVAGFGVELVLKLKSKGDRKKAVWVSFLSVIVCLVIISILPDNLLKARFSKETFLGLNELSTGSHNRYTIWLHSFKLIKQNPIIGYGCGNFFSAIETVYKSCASHNLYILLIVEGGIIGIILFGRYIFKLLRDLYKRKEFSTFALLVTVLIMAFSLDSITYKYFWMALIYSRLIIKKNDYEKNNSISQIVY